MRLWPTSQLHDVVVAVAVAVHGPLVVHATMTTIGYCVACLMQLQWVGIWWPLPTLQPIIFY